MADKGKPVLLNVRLLAESIYYRWKLIVVPVVSILVALIIVTKGGFLPKKYNAHAQVLVQESISVNPFLEDMQVPWTVQQRLPVIQAILVSRSTLEQVLTELGEVNDNTTAHELDDRISAIRQQLSVYGTGGGLVTIQFVGGDPDRIYATLKLLVDILIDAMLRPQKQSLEDASKFLEKQLIGVRADLIAIEGKIEKFKQENVGELPEVFRANLDSYMSNQGSLLQAQTELRAARMRQRNLEQRLIIYNPVARELESSLVQSRTRLGELRAIYNEEHPEIIALTAHIKQLRAERKKANIKGGKLNLSAIESAASIQSGVATTGAGSSNVESRTTDIITGDLLEFKALGSEIAALQGAVSSLKKHGKETLDSVKSFATTERSLQELMRDHEVKQNTYTTLLEKYEEARVTKALSMYDEDKQIVLIEAPRLPTTPVGISGKTPLLFLTGLLVAIAFGISIIVVIDFFGGYVRSVGEFEETTKLPVIGILPRLYDFKDTSSKPRASP